MAQGPLKKAKANTSTKRYGFHRPFNLLPTAVALIRSLYEISPIERWCQATDSAATERNQPRIVDPGWASALRGQRLCSGCVLNGAGAHMPEAAKADHARGAARPMGRCRMAGRVLCPLRNSVRTGQIDYCS